MLSHVSVHALGEALDEMLYQQRDVLTPFPQCRDVEGKNI
jgi:hypothetical protein